MQSKAFIHSPLITPSRLAADVTSALAIAPLWASLAALADDDPDLPMIENLVVVRVGDVAPDQYLVHPISLAILFELTRPGGLSVTTNRNHKAAISRHRFYLKLTFTDAPEDNMPVSRLVMDAKPREAVIASDDLRDLHPAALRKSGGGKPTKNARAVAMKHARSRAESKSPDGFDLDEYVENLWALFAFHDTVFDT
jgi:hypothetical protein